MSKQLPLDFKHRSNQSFDDYFSGENEEVVSHLKQCSDKKGEPFIFVWGPSGTGKTHLLQACCQQTAQTGDNTFYLELKSGQLPDPSILEGLEDLALVCIDNIHLLHEIEHHQEHYFNFFNRITEQGNHLIISANCLPTQLNIPLTDLKTRLNWGLTLKLDRLSDANLMVALSHKAHRMGFDISPQAATFILSRYTRELTDFWALLNILDHATLSAQRKVTVPFLKETLNL